MVGAFFVAVAALGYTAILRGLWIGICHTRLLASTTHAAIGLFAAIAGELGLAVLIRH